MIEGIIVSNTGLNASQSLLDTAGNNLANINTDGFKANRVLFQDLFYVTLQAPAAIAPAGTQLGLGVRLSSTDKLFTEGTLINTGRSLDVAIVGNGFFQVTLPGGSTAYTRNGSFQIDPTGRLVTTDGFLVQPPIIVPTNFPAISFAPNGVVSVTTPSSIVFQPVGQLTLTLFANPPGLIGQGSNLFLASGASGRPVTAIPGQGGAGTLQQGFLEGSNVNPATELTNLLIAQQTFVANSQVIVAASEMLSDTVGLIP